MSKINFISFIILLHFIMLNSFSFKNNKICSEKHKMLHNIKPLIENFKINAKLLTRRNLALQFIDNHVTLQNSDCTENTANYSFDDTANSITRNTNSASLGEKFVLLNQKFVPYSVTDPVTASVIITYNLSLINIGDGPLFFGYCKVDQSCLAKDVIFTGIAIVYFGPDCFHIDNFNENAYIVSGRSCLSNDLLKSFLFKVELILTTTPVIILDVDITFDSFTYFSSKTYQQNPSSSVIDSTSLDYRNSSKYYPCVYLWQAGQKVVIS